MNIDSESGWIELHPSLAGNESVRDAFRDHALRLSQAIPSDEEALQGILDDSLARTNRTERSLSVDAAIRVITDLAKQRWSIRVTTRGIVQVRRPQSISTDPDQEKGRVRKQELIKRDEQLRKPAVRRFVKGMEKSTFCQGKPVSVFSLFRDGQDLADSLRIARRAPRSERAERVQMAINPYLQFVEESTVCEHTQLRLQDIWRYFRYTWSNQYTSTPGRWMAFLVRDRARVFHPIIGIGAIGSPIIQIRERDTWIGWEPQSFLSSVAQTPRALLGPWLVKIVNRAIDELFVDDLLDELHLRRQDLSEPTPEAIEVLKRYAETQRNLHHQFVQQKEHKRHNQSGDDIWRLRAQTHLFRSKRAFTLAEMLRTRRTLMEFLGDRPTLEGLRSLLEDTGGQRAVRTVLRKAKADRVGIAMADITVCGAVEPYNQILGGKLVSMLATSPAVITAYRSRYKEHESEIASSMAGRSIGRPAQLVFLGTTSLYGIGSSQYNRLKLPAELLGGQIGEHIQFHKLGKSDAYGTSQFSAETVAALVTLVQQTNNGRRVNSIFGEGVSPKLRKLREGLGLLGLPEGALLQHGRQRIIYGVPLIRNLKEYLLGLDDKPEYLVNLEHPERATDAIVRWWTERWLSKRIMNNQVLERLEQHGSVRPIRHGARVVLPDADPSLLEEIQS